MTMYFEDAPALVLGSDEALAASVKSMPQSRSMCVAPPVIAHPPRMLQEIFNLCVICGSAVYTIYLYFLS